MNQFLSLLFGVFVMFSGSAMAMAGDFTPITGANLVCNFGDSGMIAINASEERVWQGNPGDEEGLELQVIRFDRFRCPNAYDIQAKLVVFGEEAEVRLVTTSCGMSNVSLEYTVGDTVFDMDCEVR